MLVRNAYRIEGLTGEIGFPRFEQSLPQRAVTDNGALFTVIGLYREKRCFLH